MAYHRSNLGKFAPSGCRADLDGYVPETGDNMEDFPGLSEGMTVWEWGELCAENDRLTVAASRALTIWQKGNQ